MGWFWLFLWVWLLFALLFFLLFGQHDFVQWWIWHNSCQKKPRPIYMTHVTLHCVYVCEHCLMIFMLQRRGCVSLFLYEAALYCTDWAWLDGHCNSLNPSFAWPSACAEPENQYSHRGIRFAANRRKIIQHQHILLIVLHLEGIVRHFGGIISFLVED